MNNIMHADCIAKRSHRDFFAMQCHGAIGFEDLCIGMNIHGQQW